MKTTNSHKNRRKDKKECAKAEKVARSPLPAFYDPGLLQKLMASTYFRELPASLKIDFIIKSDSKINLFCDIFKSLVKTNYLASFMHSCIPVMSYGFMTGDRELVIAARDSLYEACKELTELSLLPVCDMTEDNISNFYGFQRTIQANVFIWAESSNPVLLMLAEELKIDKLFEEVLDVITVAMAIASKRIIFLADDFAVTYGNILYADNNKLTFGELFVSVIDSRGIWSFDKDDDGKPVKINSLRAARRSVQNWRGHNFIGEITHDEAKRISNFLGLVPVLKYGRKFVMLPGTVGGKGKGFGC